ADRLDRPGHAGPAARRQKSARASGHPRRGGGRHCIAVIERKATMTERQSWACWGAVALLALAGAGCNSKSPSVVVYTSVDDEFARPIAEQFQKETGIQVHLVPDTEETKSTGLLNRLIMEKDRPQADVFWSGDPVRAATLKSKGVSAPYRSA